MNQNVCVWENPSESNPMVETEVTSRHEVLPDAASRHEAQRLHGSTPSRSSYAVGAWNITCLAILLLESETAHNQITERDLSVTQVVSQPKWGEFNFPLQQL
jgi:hypothetical protein